MRHLLHFLLVSSFPVALYGAEMHTWTFDHLQPDWRREDTPSDATRDAVAVAGGHVAITARAHTWDRVKIATAARDFGLGTYTWRTFVPAMGDNDMASVGAFIYHDDQHELDFEIGSGKAATRRQYGAAQDDVLCYCTNQQFPFDSSIFCIKGDSWHMLTLELSPRSGGRILARWTIDGKQVKELATMLPDTTRFSIHCSVENLKFLGDHQSTRDHRALFSLVSYTPATAPGSL